MIDRQFGTERNQIYLLPYIIYIDFIMKVYYFFQGEPGESSSSPNAFTVPVANGTPITLGDFKKHFPPLRYDPDTKYFFRFREQGTGGRDGGTTWLDISQDGNRLPTSGPTGGVIFAKVERIGVLHTAKKYARLMRKVKSSNGHNSTTANSSQPFTSNTNFTDTFEDTDTFEEDLFDDPGQGSKSTKSTEERRQSAELMDFFNEPVNNNKGQQQQQNHNVEDDDDFFEGGSSRAASNLNSGVNSHANSEADLFDFVSDSGHDFDSRTNSNNNLRGFGKSDSFMASQDILNDDTFDPFNSRPANNGNSNGNNNNNNNTVNHNNNDNNNNNNNFAGNKSSYADDFSNWNEPDVDIDEDAAPSQSQPKQPLNRAALAMNRENQVNMNVRKKLEEKRERDAVHSQEERDTELARQKWDDKLTAWAYDASKKKRNVRTLLSSMHTVLWPGNKWKEVGLGDVIEGRQVKLKYRRAMLVVHPDRLAVESAEIRFIAKRVFEAINEQYREFEKLEGV